MEVPKCTLTTINAGIYDNYKEVLNKIVELYYYPNDINKMEQFIIKRDTLENIIKVNRNDKFKTDVLKIMLERLNN